MSNENRLIDWEDAGFCALWAAKPARILAITASLVNTSASTPATNCVQAERFGQINAAIKFSLIPQMTTSRTQGAQAATSCARRVPAETQVPVTNLNCSAIRPAKRKPASGRLGSAKVTASPILKKPSSSKASAVRSGSLTYPGVTPEPFTRISKRSPTGSNLNRAPGIGSPTTV